MEAFVAFQLFRVHLSSHSMKYGWHLLKPKNIYYLTYTNQLFNNIRVLLIGVFQLPVALVKQYTTHIHVSETVHPWQPIQSDGHCCIVETEDMEIIADYRE